MGQSRVETWRDGNMKATAFLTRQNFFMTSRAISVIGLQQLTEAACRWFLETKNFPTGNELVGQRRWRRMGENPPLQQYEPCNLGARRRVIRELSDSKPYVRWEAASRR